MALKLRAMATPAPNDEKAALRVVCLCAGWCGVCRDWRALFDQAAAAHPAHRFGWIDVEDEADALGDPDIETFPTLLVARGGRALFLGPVPPLLAPLNRLLDSLAQGTAAHAGAAAQALLERIEAARL